MSMSLCTRVLQGPEHGLRHFVLAGCGCGAQAAERLRVCLLHRQRLYGAGADPGTLGPAQHAGRAEPAGAHAAPGCSAAAADSRGAGPPPQVKPPLSSLCNPLPDSLLANPGGVRLLLVGMGSGETLYRPVIHPITSLDACSEAVAFAGRRYRLDQMPGTRRTCAHRSWRSLRPLCACWTRRLPSARTRSLCCSSGSWSCSRCALPSPRHCRATEKHRKNAL